MEQWPSGVIVSVVEQWNSGLASGVKVSVVEQWNSGLVVIALVNTSWCDTRGTLEHM